MSTDVQTEPSHVAPRTALELLLCQLWERLLKIDGIGVHDDFFKIGGDSITAMSLLALVSQETGLPLPAGGMFQAPTVSTMAELLLASAEPSKWTPLVPIQTGGQKTPLFCVHPGGGNVLCYLRLSKAMGEDQPFYGLQAAGVDGIRASLDSVEKMAAEYVSAIRSVQPHGPYCLAGWSAGGVIAFEMAQQLTDMGEKVAYTAIIDSGILYTLEILRSMWPANRTGGAFEMMSQNPTQKIIDFRTCSADAKLIPDEADEAQAMRIMELFQSNVRAVCLYRPRPYAGRIDLFQAADPLVKSRRKPLAEWQQLCSNTHLHVVPGNHLTVVHEPNVQELASQLNQLLASGNHVD